MREQVLQRVRAEIISGQSLPGTMYSVPSLAASLGVSSTPVREALLELSRGGLVEPMRNRG
ncbi:GntR family transcriptional regulator, partial [Escherichia coli]|uniref:GntR family transcriptional regulator n=1 Tax=Escherichia coli TaxID=562 RepID=UPI001961F641